MKRKRESEKTHINVMAGFSSYSHLLRFCFAVTFVLALVVFSVWLILRCISPGENLSIAFNKEGSTIVTVDKQPSKALVLLSSGQMWTNTGLKLKHNQKITVGATGLVNLAIHRLVDAGNKDERPRHGWVGPDGDQLKNEKPLDRLRKSLRIEPRVGYGCLLAYVRPEGEPDPGKENAKPDGVQVVGRNGELTYLDSKEREGTLFLTVNEAVVSDNAESKEAYIANQNVLDQTYGKNIVTVEMLCKRWDNIVKENYWEVWYDDNVGEFLVQISYEASNEH